MHTIAIKVAHGHEIGSGARREALCRLEGAVAGAQEHRDEEASITSCGGIPIGHYQILVAVTIEVAYSHGARTAAGTVGLGCLEGAIAGAQQHRDATIVGHRQVLHPIAIELANSDGVRMKPSREGQRRLEGSIAVTQQHRDGVG